MLRCTPWPGQPDMVRPPPPDMTRAVAAERGASCRAVAAARGSTMSGCPNIMGHGSAGPPHSMIKAYNNYLLYSLPAPGYALYIIIGSMPLYYVYTTCNLKSCCKDLLKTDCYGHGTYWHCSLIASFKLCIVCVLWGGKLGCADFPRWILQG